jgi:HSP20 family protein
MNSTSTRPSFVRPRVDVYENDTEYLLVADLPGVTKDGVDVRFDEGQLTIVGKRLEPSRTDALALEHRHADYRCAFAVPEGIDAEKIDAKLASGVLTLHVPKAAAKRARRIEVRTA